MLKFAAAGLIGVSCFMTGLLMVSRMRARVKLLACWRNALAVAGEEMCTHLRPADEALRAYHGVDKCRVWLNTLADAKDMGLAWALLEKNARTLPLMPEDIDALSPLMSTLGTLDLERQKSAFEAARAALEHCEKNAQEDMNKNARVYTTLGSLGGMLAAILII